MRVPVLALLFGLAASIAAAEPAPVERARRTLRDIESRVEPLARGAYEAKERRPVAGLLERLDAQLASLLPPQAGTAWSALRGEAVEALKEEKEFWAALGASGPSDQTLSPETAAALKRRVGGLSRAFAALFPEPGAAAGPASGPGAPLPAHVGAQASRGVEQGASAAEKPDMFFDGAFGRGGAEGKPQAAGAPSTSLPAPEAKKEAEAAAPFKPQYVLQINDAVPSPAGSHAPHDGAAAAAEKKPGILGEAAPAALKDAVAATPLAGPPIAKLASRRVQVPAAKKEAKAQPVPGTPEDACREALRDRPTTAEMCRSSPRLAAVLGGLLEALEEQFGTVEGIVTNLAFLLAGLLISAVSGVGLVLKFIIGLASIALMLGPLVALIKEACAAIGEAWATQAGDVRNSRAWRAGGKAVGATLALVLMGFLGYKLGTSTPGVKATAAMTGAITARLNAMGLSRLTAPSLSLATAPGGAKNAAQASKASAEPKPSAEPIPRSEKSKLQFSEETLRRNAGIADREVRIGETMKQLGTDRAFAEKVAAAHEQVPCAAGGCTPRQLRRKLEIMGRGPQADAAIRSGLAGGPAKPPLVKVGGTWRFIKVTSQVGEHYYKDGVIATRPGGIIQAHIPGKFYAALRGQGEVLGEPIPVPGYEGMWIVKYSLYKQERGVLLKELKADVMIKTLVDPRLWPEEKIVALAKALFDGKLAEMKPLMKPPKPNSKNPTFQVDLPPRGSVSFSGWVDRVTGELKSFGANIVE